MARYRVLRIAVVCALVLFALLGGLYCAGLFRQSRETRHPLVKDIPAERLKYTVTSALGESGAIRVDTSPLTTLPDGRTAYRITYSLETASKISAIYVLSGQVSVFVDATNLLPIEYEELVTAGLGITGGTQTHSKLVYDQAKHLVAYYKDKDEKEGLDLAKTRTVPPNVHHFTSLIYYVRDLQLVPGKEVTFTMADRRKNIVVKVSILREEEYEGFAGDKRRALVLQTMSDFGKAEMKDAGFLVWLDTADRYVARIDAKTKWGTISAKLVKRTLMQGASPAIDDSSRNHTGPVPVDPAPGKTAP